jgi:hypothetical protein
MKIIIKYFNTFKKIKILLTIFILLILILFLINLVFYKIGLKYLPKNINSLKITQIHNTKFIKLFWLMESGDIKIEMKPMIYNLLFLFYYDNHRNNLSTTVARLILNKSNNILTQNIENQNYIYTLSVWISKHWTAEECLEYISTYAYFGNNYYGIDKASNGYYNKSLSELSLEELAYLILMFKNPVYYDKIKFPDRSKKIIIEIVNKISNSKNIRIK